MRIALFSDIHANLPALEACLQDMDSRNPDAVYCLGDLVGYHVWPNEVIDTIRNRKIPTITGNYDLGIGLGIDDCGCAYKTDIDKANGAVSIAYTNANTGDEQRAFLRTLPAHIRLEFQLNGQRQHLLLVHGSPRKVNEYLFEDREEKSLLHIMREAGADILCFGHTHKPWYRKIVDDGKERHAINIGSVGKPKDGNPQGCYVLLHIDGHLGIKVEFIRFDYDVERSAGAIEASPLPNAYAESLRNGI